VYSVMCAVYVQAVTVSGYKLSELYISEGTLSEALRLFIKARMGKECDMSLMLRDRPFQCLSVTMKCDIVVFIVNELLCSRLVMKSVFHICLLMAT
jgi:hypothetical protein